MCIYIYTIHIYIYMYPASPKAIIEMVVSIKTIVAHPPLGNQRPLNLSFSHTQGSHPFRIIAQHASSTLDATWMANRHKG